MKPLEQCSDTPAATPDISADLTAPSCSTVELPSGVTTCFDVFGDPSDPPLLLIQGLGAQLIGWHPDFALSLARSGFYVLRQDNRDAGWSDHFPGGDYTLVDMARDSVELLEALGLAPAHLVGQSMGGMIAQQIALDRPDVVRSLGLIYTSAHTGHIVQDSLAERERMPVARDRAEAIELYVQAELMCAGPEYPQDESWLRALGAAMYDRDHDRGAAQRQLAAIHASPDRVADLGTLGAVPTAVIYGDGDRLIDPVASAELHRLIPGSTLTGFAGMGHALPRPLWPSILDVLRNNAQGRRG